MSERFFAEHFPNRKDKTKALCGQKGDPIILDMLADNDPDFYCKRCQKIACPDCFGTGIMGGKQFGIYCGCYYGYCAEDRNEGTDNSQYCLPEERA